MADNDEVDYDAVVVGAGWAGMYMLYRLRELGFRAVVIERGDDVGGTWYWNRYPGARCDVPSLVYSYSFSEDLQQAWHWSELYASQPEIERYAHHVAERFSLRPHIDFGQTVESVVYDDDAREWTATTAEGRTYRSRMVFLATGGYSEPVLPDIPGIGAFGGSILQTAAWPREEQDFRGKRVAVIGTGSSGMQTATALAKAGVDQLYVFQRTPNFSVPSGNKAIEPDYEAAYKARYPEHRQHFRRNGTVFEPVTDMTPTVELDEETFEARFQDGIHVRGGLELMRAYPDLLTREEGNERIAERLRRQIGERVGDSDIVEALTPRDHVCGSRRLMVEDGYYEIYNQPNVTLINLRETPIVEITDHGVETSDGEIPLDVIIMATGFDSATGAISRLHIKGRDGETVADKWAAGPRTYLGVGFHGFPNLFSIAGPGSPSIRSQVMESIEQHVEWLTDLLKFMQEEDIASAECTLEAENQWTDAAAAAANATLLVKDDTQYIGANIPGKPRVYTTYVGGTVRYRTICDAVRAKGYVGFRFENASGTAVPVANQPDLLQGDQSLSSIGVI